MSTYMVRSYS